MIHEFSTVNWFLRRENKMFNTITHCSFHNAQKLPCRAARFSFSDDDEQIVSLTEQLLHFCGQRERKV